MIKSDYSRDLRSRSMRTSTLLQNWYVATHSQPPTDLGARIAYKVQHVAAQSLQPLMNKVAKINPRPVLVIGNQKSGTTAIAALLAKRAGVSVTLDIPPLWGPAVGCIRNHSLSFADIVRRNRWAFSRAVIKEPALTFIIEDVLRYFDAATPIFVLRDPRDNIRSILNRVSLPGDGSGPLAANQQVTDPGWADIIDGRSLAIAADSYVETLARRWKLSADSYLAHADRCILICYEDFERDKQAAIEKLAHDVRLSMINDIRNFVDIQFQPRGNRDVPWRDFFGSENLSLIEEICGETMIQFGYQPSS